MRKQYISKPADVKAAYKDVGDLIDITNKAIYDFINATRPYANNLEKSLLKPGVKSGAVSPVSELLQAAKKLDAVLEESSKRLGAKTSNAASRYDQYFVIRVKTKTGYVKSEVVESRLRAASNLRLSKDKRDAVKSFNTNSPQVYAMKFNLRFTLDKFIGQTDDKLKQVGKIYSNMNLELANYKRTLDDNLKKAYEMMMSIHPNDFSNFQVVAKDLVDIRNNIDVYFDNIVKDLMNVRARIDQNVQSINQAMEHYPGYTDEMGQLGGF